MIPSLKLRLVIMLLSLGALAWLLLAALTYRAAHTEAHAMFDAQLAQVGRLLVVVARHEAAEGDYRGFRDEVEENLRTHPYEAPVIYQAWSKDRRLFARSAEAPTQRLSPAVEGFADARVGGEMWRVLSITDPATGHLVQVANRFEDRDRFVEKAGLTVLMPLLWFVPLTVLLILIGVGRGLAPLGRLARELSARDHRSLHAIATDRVPAEVSPLVHELNRLFARFGDALARHRRFTADAAHELRNPLAGIRIQAQVALMATDESTRRTALEMELTGVERATRVIEQMMTLARVEPEEVETKFENTDLHQVAVAVLADLAPRAIAGGVEISLENGRPVSVAGNEELLGHMVRNLADNAIRYTPPGGVVTVRVGENGTGGYLVVEDTGPGIPPAERDRVFDRFYRGGHRDKLGCGLGLSIVRRVAELHHASIDLADGRGGRGLEVRVGFPKAG